MQLSFESDDGDVVRVKVKGKILADNVPTSEDPLGNMLGSDVYGRKVLLSMMEAELLNSNGVSWLLVCHKRFKEAGGRFVLHSIPPLIQKVLKVLRMQLVFELAESDRDAYQLVVQGDES